MMKLSLAVFLAVALTANHVVLGLRAANRELTTEQPTDCGAILRWKLYTPGVLDVTGEKPANVTVPGFFSRINNNSEWPAHRFVNYNIMMYTEPWMYQKESCGVNTPKCGFIKLYNEDTKKPVIRSGKDFIWPYMLTGDTPCYSGTPEAGRVNKTGYCDPAAVINDAKAANRNLPPGRYSLWGDTYSNCDGEGAPPSGSGDLDSNKIYFTIKAGRKK
jgi:hypothetical protein